MGVRIPISTQTICARAWFNCANLEFVVFSIDSNVEDIGTAAFCGCAKLKYLKIRAKVRKIGEQACRNCSSLRSVEFAPDSKLEVISKRMFSGCTALRQLEVPLSVVTFDVSACSDCPALTCITFAPEAIFEPDQIRCLNTCLKSKWRGRRALPATGGAGIVHYVKITDDWVRRDKVAGDTWCGFDDRCAS
jgi:hypothetical protein